MEKEIEKFNEHFGWTNKLCDYELKYRHDDDCMQSGCPYHIAKFSLNHVGDTYSISLDRQEIHLDGTEFALLLDFAKRLTE